VCVCERENERKSYISMHIGGLLLPSSELCVCERESEKRRERATYGCMLVAFCFLVLRCVCVRERCVCVRERESHIWVTVRSVPNGLKDPAGPGQKLIHGGAI